MEKEPGFVEESEKQEQARPNLLKDFYGALDAVMAIENEMTSQLGPEEKSALSLGMSEALARLEEEASFASESETMNNSNKEVSGFSGLHGFNRYTVRGDGSIVLSKSHSTTECIKKAQELGVDLGI